MAGLSINIKVDDAGVKAALNALSARVSNMAPVMRMIGDTLKNDALRNFKEQHAPDGTPWQALSRVTLLARAHRLSGGKGTHTKKGKIRAGAQRIMNTAQILLDRGQLRASITVQEATATSVTVGSRSIYAAIHQFGGKTGRGHKTAIKARPFIGMSPNAERDILDAINRHLAATP